MFDRIDLEKLFKLLDRIATALETLAETPKEETDRRIGGFGVQVEGYK